MLDNLHKTIFVLYFYFIYFYFKQNEAEAFVSAPCFVRDTFGNDDSRILLFLFQGDEGGPLVEALGAGEYKLIGISSFHSYFGCISDTPAGFTRVSRYLDWISETAGILIE